MAKSAGEIFNEIIDLTEQTVALMESFGEFETKEQEDVLISYFTAQTGKMASDADLPIRLIRTAEMLIGLGGEAVARHFGAGLDSPNLDIRMLSGDSLMHLGEDGVDAIMPAVEVVLEKESTGAEEMPFILAELDDPEVPSVLARFLRVDNAQVVASAIEACIEAGNDDTRAEIEKLTSDERAVELDDPHEEEKSTIGQIAKEALELMD